MVYSLTNIGKPRVEKKFLAYTSLTNSATREWKDFDIDRTIVIDDFENKVTCQVDFIDDKDYSITRQTMDIPITHTDGCGMIDPELSRRNFMVRLPFVKGLLCSFPFRRFIEDNNCVPIIKDIYGEEHNIIEENIQVIFTKSQFKMYKYYKDWNEYKEKFKMYRCQAGVCNEEENYVPHSKINYQMLQTLYDMTDDEIKAIASESVNQINGICTDAQSMLRAFGAADLERCKTGFQRSLNIYPELLSDNYTRETLKDIKNNLENELYSGRLKLDCKYSFVVPDLYAACEYWFLHINDPKGLLRNGEVSCRLYKNGIELDCLRSPHLYIEHAIQNNVVDGTTKEWFTTDAVYASCHSPISKILQFDSDGDKLLLVNNATIINAAKRVSKDVVPLYYNMGKAGAVQLNADTIYEGLMLAYTSGNIGSPSNDITKIWNSGEITEEKKKAVKWLCADVNYTIDYAKTLYKPKRPDYVNDIIMGYTKSHVPAFFKYAKQKDASQVESETDSVVDRLHQLFPKKRFNFYFRKTAVGKFNYRLLLKNPIDSYDEELANKFTELVSTLKFNRSDDETLSNYLAVFDAVRDEMNRICSDIDYVVDNLVLYMFSTSKKNKKKAFWTIYGDVVYEHLRENLEANTGICRVCGKRFYRQGRYKVHCPVCAKHHKIEKKKKTITCVDCGKKVQISSKARKRIRCDECLKAHKQKLNRQRQQKFRDKITHTEEVNN